MLLARAKLSADEQMCWYLKNTYELFALISPGLYVMKISKVFT